MKSLISRRSCYGRRYAFSTYRARPGLSSNQPHPIFLPAPARAVSLRKLQRSSSAPPELFNHRYSAVKPLTVLCTGFISPVALRGRNSFVLSAPLLQEIFHQPRLLLVFNITQCLPWSKYGPPPSSQTECKWSSRVSRKNGGRSRSSCPNVSCSKW